MTTNAKKPGDSTKKEAAKDATERRGSMAALAVNVPAVTRAAIGSRGFAEAGLITHWAEIIGPDLARGCQPDQLRFPKGERSGGTLTLRCLGAMALELQHQTPILIERINSYFGYRAIAQLRLIQGSLRRQPQRRVTKLPPLAPADREATEASLAALPESEVKEALRRLGDAIQQRAKLSRRR